MNATNETQSGHSSPTAARKKTPRTPISPGWCLLKSTLTKYQWRQIRRKEDACVVFDLDLPYSQEQLSMLEQEGFTVINRGYSGGCYTTISPPAKIRTTQATRA
jgi:hypothetical protein